MLRSQRSHVQPNRGAARAAVIEERDGPILGPGVLLEVRHVEHPRHRRSILRLCPALPAPIGFPAAVFRPRPSCASCSSVEPTVMVPAMAVYAMCCPPTSIVPCVVESGGGGAGSVALSVVAGFAAVLSSCAQTDPTRMSAAAAIRMANRRCNRFIFHSPGRELNDKPV